LSSMLWWVTFRTTGGSGFSIRTTFKLRGNC
jgi:hypothetical protein